MLIWSSNLVDFQPLIQTNFLRNRSLKIYFPLVTGHPVHMYIAEVYLLHCSSNLVAPSSPPRASTMYPVCISLSLSLSSSLSAFHVHAHGFISLSLLLVPHPISPSPSPISLSIPQPPSPSPFPFSLRTNVRKWIPYLDLEWFSKSFAHMRPPTQTHTTHVTAQCTRIYDPRAHSHTHTHIPDRYYDDRYARTTFFPSSPPLFLSSRAPPRISSGPFATGWQPARIHWCYHEPGHRSSTCSISVGSAISKWIFLSSSSCLSLLCVRACVCVCVRVFFFTVTTRLTRSNEGMIGKLEAEDRAVCSKGFVFTREHFFSLSLSLSLRSFFLVLFFFLLTFRSFLSILSLLFRPFYFFCSLFLSFLFALVRFVFPNDRSLSMLLKGVDGYRWNGCLWEVPVLKGFLLQCNRLIGVVKEVWLISRLRLINLEVDLN